MKQFDESGQSLDEFNDNIQQIQRQCSKKLEVNATSDKKIKKKRIYNPKQIVTVTFPQKLIESARNKRKFQVVINYIDEFDKKRRRVVKFGNYKQKDLVDKHQGIYQKELNKNSKIDKLKHAETIMQSNYWRKYLLNTSEDLRQNFLNIIEMNNIDFINNNNNQSIMC